MIDYIKCMYLKVSALSNPPKRAHHYHAQQEEEKEPGRKCYSRDQTILLGFGGEEPIHCVKLSLISGHRNILNYKNESR